MVQEPEVSVIFVTSGDPRRPIREALESVAVQDYQGPLRLLIMCDGRRHDLGVDLQRLSRRAGLRHDVFWIGGELLARMPPVARVAQLRQLTLQLVDSPRVCLLDDDNRWAPDHLSSLAAVLDREGVPAAHSWRSLIDERGTPWPSTRFPWLPAGAAEREMFALYREHGVLDPASPVVRDRASLVVDGRDYGMVDAGEWLFATSLLKRVGFETRYSAEELADRVGEDDKLLWRLRELGVPIACSESATLIYRLGGFSNREEGEGESLPSDGWMPLAGREVSHG